MVLVLDNTTGERIVPGVKIEVSYNFRFLDSELGIQKKTQKSLPI